MALTFRQLLDGDELIVAPGAYDAITARAVERAGFPMVHMTGAGVAASRGYPDYGLLTMTEMVDSAAILARSVSIPVLADADTGYGNELNVTRTVREYESRGVAGIHLEDQVSPKRCGHLAGKQVVEPDRFTSMIAAAVSARSSKDFIIVARSDAASLHGLDDAVGRVNAALDVGADVGFVESPGDAAAVAAVPSQVHGPCLVNVAPGGAAPIDDLARIAACGYRVALCPGLLLGSGARLFERLLDELAATGVHPRGDEISLTELYARMGAPHWDAIRARVAGDAPHEA